jgi:hypothetical protein
MDAGVLKISQQRSLQGTPAAEGSSRGMDTMKSKRVLAVLVLCVLSLSAIAAVPSRDTPAQELSNEQWVAGALTGNNAGAFAYYTLNYEGKGHVVTIEVRFAPADPVTKRGFNFNVYGNNGYYIGRGLSTGDVGGDGVLQVKWADENPATWLVQVYNYLPNQNVGFGIMAKGLPIPEPTPPPAPTPPPGPPVPLIGAGYLDGRAGGSFTYYNVTLASGSADMQLTMSCWPDDANIAKNVGLLVYGPQGDVYRGTMVAAGERRVTLPASVPGAYRVQVYNYINGLTIRYILRSP